MPISNETSKVSLSLSLSLSQSIVIERPDICQELSPDQPIYEPQHSSNANYIIKCFF